jgi:transcriptional regulator with XRE-family HTH domain
MATLGDRIRDARETRKKWTQDDLAKETGLSKSFLSEIENDKRTPSAGNVLRIANALGVSLDYLLRGETGKEEREREAIQIPVELSRAAEKEHWIYRDILMLLEAHNSVIARRSTKSLRPPTEEEWKRLYDAIKKVYP